MNSASPCSVSKMLVLLFDQLHLLLLQFTSVAAPHHVQLAVVRRQGRHGVGGQSAGCQGVVGVHGRAVLVVSVSGDG